jgi:hypothetical protein
MSYFINADHGQFEHAAQAIDDYVNYHRYNMKNADKEVEDLFHYWQGVDYTQFKMNWEASNTSGSVSDAMLNALESYAGFLRYCAKKYMEAQTDAYNKAVKIPKK